MGNKVYVGNLSWSIRNDRLKEVFAEFGEVVDARVITDRVTRRSKGFGFVTFASDEEAAKAISAMDGKEVEGRALKVNEAKEMEPRDRE
jgi:RNA recognition motif-containing protein